MKLVDFLRICRSHTAPATVILLTSSYVSAGGSLFSLTGLTLFLYGIILHMATFGHNVVMDYFFDLEDPGKSHHPLTSGRVSLKRSVNYVHPLLAFSLFIGLFLAFGNCWSMFFFSLFMIGGFLYNNWLSKTTVLGWMPITLCFTSLSIYSMLLNNYVNMLYAVYIMFTIWFQIGWSGYLKEIQVYSQENLLRVLGVKVENGVLIIPIRAKLYGTILKMGNVVTAMFLLMGQHLPNLIISLFLLTGVLYMLWKTVLRSRNWDRITELKNMGFMEIFTIYLGMFSVMKVEESLVLALFGIVWYVLMNRYLWQTPLVPRV